MMLKTCQSGRFAISLPWILHPESYKFRGTETFSEDASIQYCMEGLPDRNSCAEVYYPTFVTDIHVYNRILYPITFIIPRIVAFRQDILLYESSDPMRSSIGLYLYGKVRPSLAVFDIHRTT